jgi:hypothetical protein
MKPYANQMSKFWPEQTPAINKHLSEEYKQHRDILSSYVGRKVPMPADQWVHVEELVKVL